MSNSNVNYFKEKLVLREEEKSLREMLTKFQDQLNRLKIEELALLSHIKMQEEESAVACSSNIYHGDDLQVTKEQALTKKTSGYGSEGGSSISSVALVGLMYHKSPDKTVKEELDLAVKQGYGLDQDLEKEEEEDEDEENCDENPLYSYMDTV